MNRCRGQEDLPSRLGHARTERTARHKRLQHPQCWLLHGPMTRKEKIITSFLPASVLCWSEWSEMSVPVDATSATPTRAFSPHSRRLQSHVTKTPAPSRLRCFPSTVGADSQLSEIVCCRSHNRGRGHCEQPYLGMVGSRGKGSMARSGQPAPQHSWNIKSVARFIKVSDAECW